MKRIVLALLYFYKRIISPFLPPSCRFYPSCSAYAADAITKKGVVKGSLLSVWRILRCNPFSTGGVDQVS